MRIRRPIFCYFFCLPVVQYVLTLYPSYRVNVVTNMSSCRCCPCRVVCVRVCFRAVLTMESLIVGPYSNLICLLTKRARRASPAACWCQLAHKKVTLLCALKFPAHDLYTAPAVGASSKSIPQHSLTDSRENKTDK